MSRDLANSPPFLSLISLCAKLYTSKPIPLEADSLVIFTCGASSGTPRSAREQLLEYATGHFRHGTFFRAEDAFPVLMKSRKSDLLTIEHLLADYADCVVIINESPGTLSELGALASNEKVVKKLLVINPQEYRGRPSFINRGPIAKVDSRSRFKTTIHVDLSSVSLHFDDIFKRIETNAVRKRPLPVDFSKADSWKKSDGKLRLLLLQDLLNLFCPLSTNELFRLMKTCFPNEYIKFDVELGLLVATHKVQSLDEFFVTSRSCAQHSYHIEYREWLGLRKKVVDLYRACDASRLVHLRKRSVEVT